VNASDSGTASPYSRLLELLVSGTVSGVRGVRASLGAAAGDVLSSGDGNPLDQRDPEFIRDTLPLYRRIVDLYFRPDVRGLERVPAQGPVLLVGNHSGGLYIAQYVRLRLRHLPGSPTRVHQLVHDLSVKLPALSALVRSARRGPSEDGS
jgi:hypothetical protein